MNKEELFEEVKKLTKKEKKELRKQLPKIKKTKEQIEIRQAHRKAIFENIYLIFLAIMFLCMAIAGIYVLYLELKNGYC